MRRAIQKTYNISPCEAMIAIAIGASQIRAVLISISTSKIAAALEQIDSDRRVRVCGIPSPANHTLTVCDVVISLKDSPAQACGLRTVGSVIAYSYSTRAQSWSGWREGRVDITTGAW